MPAEPRVPASVPAGPIPATLVVAASALAIGIGILAHEGAHVLAGWLAGGTPTLWTATETFGDFGSLAPAGYLALGASGSLANAGLAAIGWLVMTRSAGSEAGRVTGWFFFGVNGMLVATKMMTEPLAAYGDWMSILRPLQASLPARLLAAGCGIAGLAFMVRRSGAELARLVPDGEPAARFGAALRLLAIGALASSIVVLGGSMANPGANLRGVLLALGAGLGPFVPLTFGLRFVKRIPSVPSPPSRAGARLVSAAAAVTVAVVWFVVGPGIRL